MKKNLIIFITAAVILLVAFWYLGTSGSNSSSLLSTDQTGTQSSDAQYIYSLLQQMAAVKLDDSIFSNAVFQNLKDNTVSFPPQQAGRANPFAPVGSTGGQVSTTTVHIKS